MHSPISVRRSSRVVLILSGACLLLSLAACSGGGSGAVTLRTGTPSVIAFTSYRALDGSDSVNSAQPYGILPVANIWTIKSDGSGLNAVTQLSGTAVGADSRDPQWSPDGSKIVYSSGRALDGTDNAAAGGAINVWISNEDGSGASPLTQMTTYAPCWAPVWSPDGTKIAYFSWRGLDGSNTSSTPNGTRNIWVMNADGSNNHAVTQLTAIGADSYYPRWSPDSTRVAYYSGRALDGTDNANGQHFTQNIWIVNADGTGSLAVTQTANQLGGNQDAWWSKDGSEVAFSGSDGNIWTVHTDGSAMTRLTSGNGYSAPYSWSPDGSKILFELDQSLSASSENIWTMNTDGSGQTPLTKLTAAGAGPGAWSADGTRVAYASDRAFDGSDSGDANPAVDNIWLVQADGSGSVSLSKLTKADSTSPAWKP